MITIWKNVVEINDKGWSDGKLFANKEDAVKYLRKIVASYIWAGRRTGESVKYLNVYREHDSIEFPYTIEVMIGRTRYDFRVRESFIFESESEFNKYPIQM